MPLRSLIGYDPRNAKSNTNYRGQSVTFSQPRAVMATKKQKYQAPMARVQKLPPIDEEFGSTGSFPNTPRNSQNVQSVRRVPRDVFQDDDFLAKPSPVKSRPVIPVQPRLKTPPSPPPLKKYDGKEHIHHKDFSHLSPKDVNHTLVDGLVADYLHYARYGHVIPVYEGTSNSTCPCCTDRNRQNVRSLLGFPNDTSKTQKATKYDHKSSIRHAKNDEELTSDTSMYPNSMYAQLQRQKAKQKEPTPEEKRMKKIVEQSHRGAWMNYQPLPYATNYLNPEFNRPSEVYGLDARGVDFYMRHRVLEADSNYDSAMNKLSNYGGYR